jgi:hypothetical protein
MRYMRNYILVCFLLVSSLVVVAQPTDIRRGGGSGGGGQATNVMSSLVVNPNQLVTNGGTLSIKDGALFTNISVRGNITLPNFGGQIIASDGAGNLIETAIGSGLAWDGTTLSAIGSSSSTTFDHASVSNELQVGTLSPISRATRLGFLGNSRLTGAGSIPWWLTNVLLTNNITASANPSIAGRFLVDMVYTDYTNSIQPLKPAGGTNGILLILDAINDIANGSNFAGTVSLYAKVVTAAKSDGWNKVILATCEDIDSQSAAQRMVLQDINTWIRTNELADGVLDVASYRPLKFDGTHWTTNMAKILAGNFVTTLLQPKMTQPDISASSLMRYSIIAGNGDLTFGGWPNVHEIIQGGYPALAMESTTGGGYMQSVYGNEYTIFGNTSGTTIANNQLFGVNQSRFWFGTPVMLGGTGTGSFVESNNVATTNFNIRPNALAAGSGITIRNDGNVGIGTNNPVAALEINTALNAISVNGVAGAGGIGVPGTIRANTSMLTPGISATGAKFTEGGSGEWFAMMADSNTMRGPLICSNAVTVLGLIKDNFTNYSGSIGVDNIFVDMSAFGHLVMTNVQATNQTIFITNVLTSISGLMVETIGTNFSTFFSAPPGTVIQWPNGVTNSLCTNTSFNIFPVKTNLVRITTQNFL